jgi:hypothetical protein
MEKLIRFDALRGLTGFSARSLRQACNRHRVPIVKLNRRVFALRASDYETLLTRASGKESV